MKQTINESDFHAAFERLHPNNFSYEGRSLLFEFLEEMESDTGEEYELDVIALCCDWMEADAETIIQDYDLDRNEIIDAIDDYADMDEAEQAEALLDEVENYLQRHTTVVGQTGESVIYLAF